MQVPFATMLVAVIACAACGVTFETASPEATGAGGATNTPSSSAATGTPTSSVGGNMASGGAPVTTTTTVGAGGTGASGGTDPAGGAGGTGGSDSGTGTGGANNTGACVPIGGAVTCNPITNQGCSGSTCDWSFGGGQIGSGFTCFASPSVVPTCSLADPDNNQFCIPGSTYNPNANNLCQKYCCTDDDCDQGTCGNKGLFVSAPDLGLCTCR